MTAAAVPMCFLDQDLDLLLDLIRINTISPMESGQDGNLPRAQARYEEYAATLGFETVHWAPPPKRTLEHPFVPSRVLEVARTIGPERFLAAQPNLILRLGPPSPPDRTIVLNFHMDTVGGEVPVGLENGRLTGRGAVDAKGPGVALLAGIRSALVRDPDLASKCTILVQSVGGEEGGAMGVYGSRFVVENGWYGALNLVCEPTGEGVFDRTTTSMTARIKVEGAGATDDEPERGLNATLILSAVALGVLEAMDEPVRVAGGKLCIAGLHSGTMHNRVYGTGSLAINLAYPSVEVGRSFESQLEATVESVVDGLEQRWQKVATATATIVGARKCTKLTWEKRSLPVLANRHVQFEALFSRIGWPRHADKGEAQPFTCDAMWFGGAGAYTVVAGPGGLGVNGAHTSSEWVEVDALNTFAGRICDLLVAFAGLVEGKRE